MFTNYLHSVARWFLYIFGTILFGTVILEVVIGYPVFTSLLDKLIPPVSVVQPTSSQREKGVLYEEVGEEVSYEAWYPVVEPMMIGAVPVRASVARTQREHVQGLSGTPGLPADVVKLFIFPELGEHSIWMKDMNYPIDIAWVSEDLEIVHIEERVDPSTYPNSFSSPVPARYVIETGAGFFEKNQMSVGTRVQLP